MSAMKKEYKNAFDELFEYIYKSNSEAAELSVQLLEMAHVLDDMIDRDNPVSDQQIYSFALSSLFGLPNNPIWVGAGLNHHLLNVFLRWRDANYIESDPKATDDDLAKCYMLRAGIYDLFVIIAYYLHGEEWAAEIGPTVRRFYGETLKDYLKEMKNA